MTQLGDATRYQSGPGSDCIEEVLSIPKSSCITGASPPDKFVPYPEQLLGESYTTVEMQLVYSTTPTNWDSFHL